MPAEDEYGRRQVSLASPSQALPVPCPAGCPVANPDYHHQYGTDYRQQQQDRYASEKNLHHSDRYLQDHRFGAERSSSDRLPSGERYQGVSERYPLGERPHTSVSTEHLTSKEVLQGSGGQERQEFVPERYQYGNDRICQRFVAVQNVGSLDRYNTGNLDRFQRTNTPIERYHGHTNDQESISDRDKYASMEGYERPSQQPRPNDRYSNSDRHRNNSSSGNEQFDTKVKERSSVDSKLDRYPQGLYGQEYCYQSERFPAIPCPERFATNQERPAFTQVPYMEPPSPAPASDRFIPPPPLSPENTPSPDCYPSNPFPSPTAPSADRFIPPPPLSPSPTENFSPTKIQDKQRAYPDRYSSPHPDTYLVQCYNERQYNQQEKCCMPQNSFYAQTLNERYIGERYIPPNPHVPVERYVPQPQEQYYGNTYQPYERYHKFNVNDPYTRRDLTYHYRMPLQFAQNQYHRIRFNANPNRFKCCPYQDVYQISKSSPGSSSSSSVTSQGKDLQQSQPPKDPQEYQEKAIQCGYTNKDLQQCAAFVPKTTYSSPNLKTAKQCRHVICASPTVEYVGQSGGRHVCATPPPRGSTGSGDSACSDQCCVNRKSQSTLAVAIWQATPTPQQQPPQPQTPPQQQPLNGTPVTAAKDPTPPPSSTEAAPEARTQEPSPPPKPPAVQRTISLPASMTQAERYRPRVDYTQSERTARDRPKFARSSSRKEAIKNYIKKETANFFGVDEENEEDQRQRWLDRRKRLACRTCGPLKEEYRTPSLRTLRRTVSEAPGRSATMVPMQALSAGRPDVLPGPSDATDSQEIGSTGGLGLRGKDSVVRMTWNGLSYVVSTLTRHGPRQLDQRTRWSRSFPPETPASSPSYDEDAFFERLSQAPPKTPEDEIDTLAAPSVAEEVPINRYVTPSGQHGWKRAPKIGRGRQEEPVRSAVGCTRIFSSMLDRVLDNSDRRQYGMGWVGRMFGRSVRRSVVQDEDILNQLDDMEDHRPLFTYWVTTVQILVLIISLICYGFGPFGIDLQSRSGQVLVTSLSLQQVDYMEPANFWFGPRAADLIHLGAKFGPCMRVDNKIIQQIDKTKAKERDTACCIRNDDSGCVQSSQADCSIRGLRPTKTISTWKKWSVGESGPGGRISGSVCGLDPKFCDAPASVHPYEWPDDITKWPICRKTNTQFSIQKNLTRDKLTAEHMVCEVIGHPCCIGIHGQCRITTREYCDFVRGTFHEEASLCSQVSCLNDVCGMIPFYFPQTPDQFYRLWTSLFLHAGILQLTISILVQYFLMRDLEKLTGSLRIGIIYMGAGVAGNLASAIFVPYRADVGPAGSQFGLLACLIVEVLNAWPMLKHPKQALCKLLSITFVLFCVGLVPWVDNYAHLFGFVFGFLLSYALLPFISFGQYERQKKVVLIWVCLLSAGFLFVCLILLFYIIPVYDCKVCSYFNCLPLTNDFCASQNINFKREVPVV